MPLKVFLNPTGLVTTDPHTPELNGIWSQVLLKLINRNDVEVYFDQLPMTREDLLRLMQATCRDEELIGATAMLVQVLRRHKFTSDELTKIVEILRSRGRLI